MKKFLLPAAIIVGAVILYFILPSFIEYGLAFLRTGWGLLALLLTGTALFLFFKLKVGMAGKALWYALAVLSSRLWHCGSWPIMR